MPRPVHTPCRERIYVFQNSSICSDFDCSAYLQVLPPPDGGDAPEGRRERKNHSFCRKKFGFSRFSILAWWPRLPAKTFGSPSYLSLSGSAAAPPSGGAKTWPRAERAGAGTFRGCLLPGRAWPGGTGVVHPTYYQFSKSQFMQKGGRGCFAASSAFWVIQRAESGRCPGPFRRRI